MLSWKISCGLSLDLHVFKFLKILTSRLLVKVKMKNKRISGSGLMKLKHI